MLHSPTPSPRSVSTSTSSRPTYAEAHSNGKVQQLLSPYDRYSLTSAQQPHSAARYSDCAHLEVRASPICPASSSCLPMSLGILTRNHQARDGKLYRYQMYTLIDSTKRGLKRTVEESCAAERARRLSCKPMDRRINLLSLLVLLVTRTAMLPIPSSRVCWKLFEYMHLMRSSSCRRVTSLVVSLPMSLSPSLSRLSN